MAWRAPLVEARPHMTTEPAYVVAYNALLSDAATAAACAETLAEGQRQGGAMWGDRPLCVSLRPNLVTKRQHSANATASESLYGALARLERALLRDAELRRELDLSPAEARLALADPGFSAASPSSRLDGFGPNGAIR